MVLTYVIGHFKKGIYIFKMLLVFFMRDRERERERERGKDTGGGRRRLHAGSRTRDLIPGLQDHDLGYRQVPNH